MEGPRPEKLRRHIDDEKGRDPECQDRDPDNPEGRKRQEPGRDPNPGEEGREGRDLFRGMRDPLPATETGADPHKHKITITKVTIVTSITMTTMRRTRDL